MAAAPAKCKHRYTSFWCWLKVTGVAVFVFVFAVARRNSFEKPIGTIRWAESHLTFDAPIRSVSLLIFFLFSSLFLLSSIDRMGCIWFLLRFDEKKNSMQQQQALKIITPILKYNWIFYNLHTGYWMLSVCILLSLLYGQTVGRNEAFVRSDLEVPRKIGFQYSGRTSKWHLNSLHTM